MFANSNFSVKSCFNKSTWIFSCNLVLSILINASIKKEGRGTLSYTKSIITFFNEK
jgi:hypothetical protein